jgi:hypothetical protein
MQAEAYSNAFFKRFEVLAEQPLAHLAADEISAGYPRSVSTFSFSPVSSISAEGSLTLLPARTIFR